MPTPFDHLEQFQALPDETKKKVMSRFARLDEVSQAKIMGKINTPMQVRDADPGLIDKSLDVAVEVAGAPGLVKAVPTLARGAVRGGKALVNFGRRATDMVMGQGEGAARLAAKQALAPLQERLVAQSEALATVPIRASAREAELLAAQKGYGTAIGKAEELGGYAIKETPTEWTALMSDPKRLNNFASSMRRLGEKGSEELAREVTPETLNTMRKFAQTFREVGPQVSKTIQANIAMGGGKAGAAIKNIDPTFRSAMSAWEGVTRQLARHGDDVVKQKAAIKGSMMQTRLAMKKTQHAFDQAIQAGAKRDAVRKALVQAGVPAVLAGVLLKTMGGK